MSEITGRNSIFYGSSCFRIDVLPCNVCPVASDVPGNEEIMAFMVHADTDTGVLPLKYLIAALLVLASP